MPFSPPLSDTKNCVAFGFLFSVSLVILFCTLRTFSSRDFFADTHEVSHARSPRASFLTHARNQSRFLTVTKQISADW